MSFDLHWSFGFIEISSLTPSTRSKIQKKLFWFHTRASKFIFAPRKDKHFIGQLWQLMTASNVSAWTQVWQAKWAVFKIEGFVCKRFLPFFPTTPRSFTCAIFCVVFDSCSSFFAPKPHRNTCYAGYIWLVFFPRITGHAWPVNMIGEWIFWPGKSPF